MLKKSALLALTGLAGLCAVAAHAEEAAKAAATPDITTTGNLTFATNYVFRGLSQTNFKPAVQGTYEAAHSSGLYLGLFGSNVSWYADAWEEAAPGRPLRCGLPVEWRHSAPRFSPLAGYLGIRTGRQ